MIFARTLERWTSACSVWTSWSCPARPDRRIATGKRQTGSGTGCRTGYVSWSYIMIRRISLANLLLLFVLVTQDSGWIEPNFRTVVYVYVRMQFDD